MIKKIIHFFDRLEDKIRGGLSRYPILYALIGGVGVIMFWRGIWHTADGIPFLTGPVSTLIGLLILFLTGIFVSAFIGNSILMTGLRGEKKLTEKTKEEIITEEDQIQNLQKTLDTVKKEIENMGHKIR